MDELKGLAPSLFYDEKIAKLEESIAKKQARLAKKQQR
jgi:hypothetical protein